MDIEIRGDYMKKNNLIWIIICNNPGSTAFWEAGWQAPLPPAITDLGWRWTKVSFISLTRSWRRERPLLILSLFVNLRAFDVVAFVAMLAIFYSYYRKKQMLKASAGCSVSVLRCW